MDHGSLKIKNQINFRVMTSTPTRLTECGACFENMWGWWGMLDCRVSLRKRLAGESANWNSTEHASSLFIGRVEDMVTTDL